MTAVERERQVLDLVVPMLKADGYTVYLHPSRQILPTFMQGYSPDAIALGKPKNIAIEIVQDEHSSAGRRERLAERFSGVSDWEIRVFYVSSFTDDLSMEAYSLETIEKALRKAEALLDASEPEAALLLGWAAFEAFGRSLLPEKRSFPLSATQLLERLAGDGAVTPEEADRLRRIASIRNAIAHGALQIAVEPSDVGELIAIFREALQDQVKRLEQALTS